MLRRVGEEVTAAAAADTTEMPAHADTTSPYGANSDHRSLDVCA